MSKKIKGLLFLNSTVSEIFVFFIIVTFYSWPVLLILKLFLFLLILGINKPKWKLVFLFSMKTEPNHS